MSRIYDSQIIKQKITQELNTLTNKHPQLQKEIEQTNTNIQNQIDEITQITQIPNQLKQSFIDNIGAFQVCHDERKSWHLYNAVLNILVLPEIRTKLEETYGKTQITNTLTQLTNYHTTISQTKYLLDLIDTNPNHPQIQLIITKYLETTKKLPLIYPTLYQLFTWIATNTNLGYNSVPNSVIQRHERKYKKGWDYDQARKKAEEQPKRSEQ